MFSPGTRESWRGKGGWLAGRARHDSSSPAKGAGIALAGNKLIAHEQDADFWLIHTTTFAEKITSWVNRDEMARYALAERRLVNAMRDAMTAKATPMMLVISTPESKAPWADSMSTCAVPESSVPARCVAPPRVSRAVEA